MGLRRFSFQLETGADVGLMALHLMKSAKETGCARARYCNRVLPVEGVCFSDMDSIVAAAGPIIKRTNNGTGPNAADMKAQCEEKWCPPDEQTALEAYLGLAETAPSSAPPRQRLPSRPELLRKLLHVRGAEGPDGWHSSEVRSIARTMPTLVDELFPQMPLTAAEGGAFEGLHAEQIARGQNKH